MNILEVHGLSKSFGKHKVLNNIDLSIPTGSIFGLLGPNGAGKTTFIRIVNQIIGPDKGSILFNDTPIRQKHIKEIGYLPEERGLYNKMKVGEHLIYLAQLKGMKGISAKRKIESYFEEFEITDWWGMKVEQLSKGMQQKLQFIISIMHDPSLVILDEPFTGFDPINTELIKKKITELNDKGTTFVLSTHRMDSVEELCNHIALINTANLILEGDIYSIKEKFKKSYYDLSIRGNIDKEFIESDGNIMIDSFEYFENGIIEARVKLNEGSGINELLEKLIKKAEIISINEVVPSLNEIFISMVNSEVNE